MRLIRHIAESDCSAPSSDAELLHRFKANRDEAAFRALVGRHGAMVFDVCRNVLGQEPSAEDAFQATFLVLAQKAGSIRKQASLASWLYGVAYRTACRARANVTRRQKHEKAAPGRTLVSPAEELSWLEVQVVLHEELSQISDAYRAPLVLCYLEGKTQDQAAQQLGVTKDTVKKRLERGRALLRVRLVRRGLGSVAVLLAASWPVTHASAMPAAASLSALAQAAALVAANQNLAGGLISAEVSALTQGVLKTMLLMKLTTVAAGVMVAGLLATGAMVAGVQVLPGTPEVQQPGESMEASGKKASEVKRAVPAALAALPPAVRHALEGNAHAFASIALTIQKQRSFPSPESKGAKGVQEGFPGVLKPCTYEYLAQDGMCYARYNQWVQFHRVVPGDGPLPGRPFSDQPLPGKPVPGKSRPVELLERWQELTCDGESVYRGAPDMGILSVVPLSKVAGDGELKHVTWHEEEDYFGMIGIEVPRRMKDLPGGPQSQVLHLLEGDGHLTKIWSESLAENTEHVVLEVLSGQQQHRFWLDPALGYAIRRHELRTMSGNLALAVDNRDFVKLNGPELWLPRHCHAEWHYWGSWRPDQVSADTLIVVDSQATRLERIHVPAEKFVLKYGAGSRVSDACLPAAAQAKSGRIEYKVPENPADLKGVIQAASEGREYVPPRSFLALWIVGSGLAVLLLCLIVAAVMRLRRRESSKTTPGANSPQGTSP
jgi:RNA polymerase sigma factor (sigma-70 family)